VLSHLRLAGILDLVRACPRFQDTLRLTVGWGGVVDVYVYARACLRTFFCKGLHNVVARNNNVPDPYHYAYLQNQSKTGGV